MSDPHIHLSLKVVELDPSRVGYVTKLPVEPHEEYHAAVKWSDAKHSRPMEDLRASSILMMAKYGLRPDTLLIDQESFDAAATAAESRRALGVFGIIRGDQITSAAQNNEPIRESSMTALIERFAEVSRVVRFDDISDLESFRVQCNRIMDIRVRIHTGVGFAWLIATRTATVG